MSELLINMIQAHSVDSSIGIYSICSANEHALKAAMCYAKNESIPLLIEATSNQVDQFGGYTGMTPGDFVSFVDHLASLCDYSKKNLILGGDHLGPNTWQNQDAFGAMQNAKDLIKNYVEAGFTKLHLDATMRCADDPGNKLHPLEMEIIAERTAELCEVAEETYQHIGENNRRLVYIIGTDVPPPGGAKFSETEIRITPVKEVEHTIQITQDAFKKRNLDEAWERVIAVVVQPGVEFSAESIFEYNSLRAAKLSDFIAGQKNLVYEAHSTDYQKLEKLREMVQDHFAILKVGPALTFAFREAIFALAHIENELTLKHKNFSPSNIMQVVNQVMKKQPAYWQKHYSSSNDSIEFLQKYGYSDRIRYYWPIQQIQKTIKILIQNLKNNLIPLTLVSQFLPNQYRAIRAGLIKNKPDEIINHKILEVLQDYTLATSIKKWSSSLALSEA
jgi:D-tagatose-1,6-bisphosphate aldolase subunit GatZ/KbaZ